jgi:hypothetical protein
MTELTADQDLSQLAGSEAMQLGDMGIDDTSSFCVKQIQRELGTVSRSLAMARGEHERLMQDDEMNPTGKARKLAELPNNIEAGAKANLDNVETAIVVLETSLRAQALAHDSSQDAALYIEMQNLSANLNQGNAMSALINIAADSRYSTLMAGSYGKSLAARFNIDHGAFTRAALQGLATNGTQQQQRAIKGLAKIPAARRAHFLAQAEASKVSSAIRARHAVVDRGYNGPSSPAAIRSDVKARAFRS